MTDIERLESLNLTLVGMLENALKQGDHFAAEKLLHHLAWNEARIERLRGSSSAA